MKTAGLILLVLIVAVAASAAMFAAQFRLSAMPEPGAFESRIAWSARHWYVSRELRKHPVTEIAAGPDTLGAAGMTFNGDCSFCHGQDGRTPTDVGQGMYPRVPSLASPEVQRWSDPELFWIVRNGIRFTGMGAFGKSLSDPQIWELVHYIRSLNETPSASK
jgi:mono/diheme cytochrome c family protein